MSRSRNITKRSLMMLLVAWITFMSVFNAYQQTTQCAEWVAGVITAVGGAPLLTALMIGGVVVAGGIAIHELAQTDAEDWRNFASGIKQGFNEFVSEQETIIAKEQDQTLSDQEAANIGVAVARDKVNNFFSNAVTTTKNAVTGLTLDIMEYWSLYSKILGNVADGAIDIPTDITPTTVIKQYARNFTSYSQLNTVVQEDNIGENCRQIENVPDLWFCQKGKYTDIETGTFQTINLIGTSTIPFVILQIDDQDYEPRPIKVTTRVRTYYPSGMGFGNVSSTIYSKSFTDVNSAIVDILPCIAGCSIPVLIVSNYDQNWSPGITQQIKDDVSILSVGGSSSNVKDYERTIAQTLNNTKAGEAIQTGRRTLVNNGDHIIGVFQEDSVPVRKSGVVVQDGVVSAPLGWNIPAGGVWDDVFSGGRPYADVVGGTGAIGVPDDVITGTKSGDTVIEYPDTADVQDTADYPRAGTDNPDIDDSKPQEIPDKPQQEIIDDQGGSFYPAVMDLTNIFPFCIPFDIIYLVDKFDIHGERAPVIEIPIVYPTLLQSSLGESYTVVIDFNDFLVVRNVLRIFLLILFIVGLLKITRDLIRG